MQKMFWLLAIVIIGGCADKVKEFSAVKKGMSKQEVIAAVGEPSKKNDILVAELWEYTDADRTIVLRNDTVFDVMTSADARIDSIKANLKETGQDIKEKLKVAGEKLDSLGNRIGDKLKKDSIDSLRK